MGQSGGGRVFSYEADTGILIRTDPRQPAEADKFTATKAVIAQFNGDFRRPRGWAIDEALRHNRQDDRIRNIAAVRISCAIMVLTGEAQRSPDESPRLSS